MSDTKLRELERRWKETGSPDDEAAYLLERVRVGDLTQERLELAAYCGHEGAAKAAPGISVPSGPTEWFDGLARRWTPGAVVRIACAMATVLAAALDDEGDREQLQDMVGAAETWLQCPCEDHANECGQVAPIGEAPEGIQSFAAVLHWTSEAFRARPFGERDLDEYAMLMLNSCASALDVSPERALALTKTTALGALALRA